MKRAEKLLCGRGSHQQAFPSPDWDCSGLLFLSALPHLQRLFCLVTLET